MQQVKKVNLYNYMVIVEYTYSSLKVTKNNNIFVHVQNYFILKRFLI